VRPGELAADKFEILVEHNSGGLLKAWTVIEEFDGESWRQVPYMSHGKFSLKRKHHFSEPITRAEALSLVQENLIPEVFKNDFRRVDDPSMITKAERRRIQDRELARVNELQRQRHLIINSRSL
jgi:hypothetical protein